MSIDDESIAKHLDAIIAYDNENIPTITEKEFIRYLLPLFSAPDDTEVDLTVWLSIAGTWSRPIKVVDDKNRSELFTIPALVGATKLPMQQTARNSAFDIIQDAQRKMQIVPRAGDEYLSQHLSKRILPTNTHKEAAAQWAAIYARYDIDKKIPSPNQIDTTLPVEGASSDPDHDGYDEL